jgi:hypothetical protein
MTVRMLDRAVTSTTTPSLTRPEITPDTGYEAVSWFAQLRDRLVAAVAERRPKRWKEPTLFFFDRRRQTELEASRAGPTADPYADVAAAIAAEMPVLFQSVEVRQVARATGGLCAAAEALAPVCPAAKDLADLLAIPDDEVIVALHPERRTGFRLTVRGVADVGQFHILLADAVTGDPGAGLIPGRPMAERFVAACRDVNPASPAGVPMVAATRFQFFAPAALQPDGTLPGGFGGCQHWLWPTMPLASIGRVGGERIVLLGLPSFAATWDVVRRFPALPAEVRMIETLSPHRVAQRLVRLTGKTGAQHREPATANANAA